MYCKKVGFDYNGLDTVGYLTFQVIVYDMSVYQLLASYSVY